MSEYACGCYNCDGTCEACVEVSWADDGFSDEFRAARIAKRHEKRLGRELTPAEFKILRREALMFVLDWLQPKAGRYLPETQKRPEAPLASIADDNPPF